MRRTKRNLIIVALISLTIVAGILWVAVSGWPPIIIRDRQYRELIVDFQRAPAKNRIRPGDNDAGWEFQVGVPESQTTALVQAVAHMGNARVKYGDEAEARALYKYVDYSSPIEIRATDRVIYVHWAETLLRTDHYILAYDLAKRCEVTRRRIDPSDLR